MLTSLIDVRTLSFVAIALGAMQSLAMLMVWLTRKTYPGFGLWTAGTGTFAVAFILLALRGKSQTSSASCWPTCSLSAPPFCITKGF
jgi:hypothetical protein